MPPSAGQASIESGPSVEICILRLAHPTRTPHVLSLSSVEPIGLARGLRLFPDLKSIRLRGSAARRSAFAAVQTQQEENHLQVFVRDNNVEQALRVLKKRMQREGVFREMKRRRFYEKPSEVRMREKSEAIRRARKLARKQAQREGLIADPRKKKQQAARALGNRQRPDARVPPTR
jgi:small subunit ribosomal protein S21